MLHSPAPICCWQTPSHEPLLHKYLQLGTYSVGFLFLPQLCCLLRFQSSPLTHLWEGFLLCVNFSSFTTSSPGQVSIPKSFASVFIFYILFYLLSKRSGCLWMPGVLHQCSELVLWKLFHIQMIFWLICMGESSLPFLFLHYLGTALGFFSVVNTIVLHNLRLVEPMDAELHTEWHI